MGELDERLQIRLTTEQKRTYRIIAAANRLDLGEWTRQAMVHEAERTNQRIFELLQQLAEKVDQALDEWRQSSQEAGEQLGKHGKPPIDPKKVIIKDGIMTMPPPECQPLTADAQPE